MLLAAIYVFLAWFAAAALVACLLGRLFRAQTTSRTFEHECWPDCTHPAHWEPQR
jgi:hypothetical protein